ncbi:MAG: D-alanine--D-alanine ligase [Armatimonadota bacterium]|nr:MAG: D-alanine--D-alanine ligase [Armatimonadota bacterium]
MPEKVMVLMGGDSTEREVSLSSGRRVTEGLRGAGYRVIEMDVVFDPSLAKQRGLEATPSRAVGLVDLVQRLQEHQPDVVFIILHGAPGEDGRVQAVLDLLHIPYTGSGVLASALALDKVMTKRVLEASGVPVAPDVVLHRCEHRETGMQKVGDVLGYPVIVKPNTQGSTIGVHRVYQQSDLATALEDAFRYDECVLIEPLLPGVELTVPVVGNRRALALPMIEIVPAGGFYDYEAKYTPGATEEIIPARVPEEIHQLCAHYALQAHYALGCRGMSRTDFIWDRHRVVALEVNTIPGMTPTSLLPRSAQAYGWSFEQLVDSIVRLAKGEEVV